MFRVWRVEERRGEQSKGEQRRGCPRQSVSTESICNCYLVDINWSGMLVMYVSHVQNRNKDH